MRPLVAYHDHNAARVRPQILARLRAGASVALVTDAGTPLVSDPGYKLVREAIAQGSEVFALPGPSAALAALTVSGLPSDRFLVAGFLPTEAGARRQAIAELGAVPGDAGAVRGGASRPGNPGRACGGARAARGGARPRADQEIRGGAARQRSPSSPRTTPPPGAPRGEVVLVIGPPAEDAGEVALADLDAALAGSPGLHGAGGGGGQRGGRDRARPARGLSPRAGPEGSGARRKPERR